jgi:hypothetical protein
MKQLFSLFIIGVWACDAHAATIVSTDVYIGSADAEFYRIIVTSESLSPEFGGSAFPGWYPYGWHGFSGGQMVIELELGETVLLAKLQQLTLSLSNQDVGPNRQLWVYDDPNFSNDPLWIPYQGLTLLHYEVQTNLGTAVKEITIVPEPSVIMVAALGLSMSCVRRRRIL